MSFKKAVFFGGAVLVLAACGDATSPTSPSALSDMNGAAAAAKAPRPAQTVPPATAAPKVPVNAMTALCGNATIHLGLDGSIIITCDEAQ